MKKQLLLVLLLLIYGNMLQAQSQRYVLVEHFTNTVCGTCASKNPAFFTLLNSATNVGKYHHISYHTPWPFPNCVLYQANTPEQDFMYDAYAVEGTPTVYLQGAHVPYGTPLLSQTQLNAYLGATSPVQIKVLESVNGNTKNVTVRIKTTGTMPAGNWKIKAAAVERNLAYTSPNGETTHKNVFRKMVPSLGVNGSTFTPAILGSEVLLTYSYSLQSNWNTAEIYTLVWIQNADTKEVLNSGTPFDLLLDGTVTPATCAQSNGTITVNASGGTAPYSYAWSNSSNSTNSITVASGSYTLTLTDATGSTQTQQFTVGEQQCTVAKLRVYLEGAWNGTNLSAATNIPLSQPYNTTPWNYYGTETQTVLPTGAIDWVLIEAKSSIGGAVLDRRACLLMSNGTLRELDGTEGAKLRNLTAGSYYLVVRHRNHLPVISANAVVLPNATAYSFTTSATSASGSESLKHIGSIYALYAGDIGSDGTITNTDFNQYTTQSSQYGYRNADCNMNGVVETIDFNLYRQNSSRMAIAPLRY